MSRKNSIQMNSFVLIISGLTVSMVASQENLKIVKILLLGIMVVLGLTGIVLFIKDRKKRGPRIS